MNMLSILAEATATADGPNVLTNAAVTAICSTVVGAVSWIMRGRQSRSVKIEGTPGVQVENQTLGVRLHDAWVTRQEFLEFKGEIKADVKDIRNSVDKVTDLLAARDEAQRRMIQSTMEGLSEKINDVASGAYEARRRIHETVNRQGERLATLEAKADISKGLASLGSAVMKAVKTNESNQQ